MIDNEPARSPLHKVSVDGHADASTTSVKLFYILDTRSCVGNCALWWAPNGQGYVCDLRAAGKYTEAEATSKRPTDVAVSCEVAEANVVHHVRVDVQQIAPYMEQGRHEKKSGR